MAKLHFYYSAMNAGKSTVLLQSDYNYKERGMDTLLYIPESGKRCDTNKITSRIGLEAEAIVFDNNFNLYEYAKEAIKKNSNIKCVLLDEAQFLTKAHVHQLTQICDELRIPVLAYGLRSDFLGEPFESSKYLLTLADILIEIKTVCHCGRKAIMNLRVDVNGKVARKGDQFEVGGNDRYVSVCRKHHREGKITS